MSNPATPIVQRFNALRGAYVLALLTGDLIAIRGGFALAYRLRLFDDPRVALQVSPLEAFDEVAILYTAVMLAAFAVRGMYRPERGISRIDLLYRVTGSAALGWELCLAATALLYRSLAPPRLMRVYWGILAVLLTWVVRMLLDGFLCIAHRRGRDLQRLLIVGVGHQADLLRRKIEAGPELGYRIVGFIGDESDMERTPVGPILGSLGDVAEVVRAYGANEVIIAWPGIPNRELVEIVTSCTHENVNIKIAPDISDLMAREPDTSELTGLPLVRVRDVALRGWSRLLKR